MKTNLLMKLAAKSNNLVLVTEMALMQSVENDGSGLVYLDNAFSVASEYMNIHQFTGYLAALTLEGRYVKTDDKCWGKLVNRKAEV